MMARIVAAALVLACGAPAEQATQVNELPPVPSVVASHTQANVVVNPCAQGPAQTPYSDGERLLAKLETIRIGDEKHLAVAVKSQAHLMREATQAFLDAANVSGDECTTAALYQIGHVFESFGRVVRDAPPPPSALTEQEKEAMRRQLEVFAVQFDDKALEAYENGLKRARELGISNEWTARMRTALAHLDARHQKP